MLLCGWRREASEGTILIIQEENRAGFRDMYPLQSHGTLPVLIFMFCCVFIPNEP